MNYLVRCAHPIIFLLLCVIIVLVVIYRIFFYKSVIFEYPLARFLLQSSVAYSGIHKKIFFCMHVLVLIVLAALASRLQLVDIRSKVTLDGIDIMIVLDVSGSMQLQDDQSDQRSRIKIAKDEALRFVDKRTNDALGLVIFAADAVTRSPLTLDKIMVKQMINELDIGIINANETVLSRAIITAANRLKLSKSASKIMIVLTDGAPSERDIQPTVAITAAQKMGIKIYTIGIGSDTDRQMFHRNYGLVVVPGINAPLLKKIADETGGKYFLARNAQDMRTIYDTIDALERTRHETDVFSKFYDIVMPLVWLLLCCIACELFLSLFIWYGL